MVLSLGNVLTLTPGIYHKKDNFCLFNLFEIVSLEKEDKFTSLYLGSSKFAVEFTDANARSMWGNPWKNSASQETSYEEDKSHIMYVS